MRTSKFDAVFIVVWRSNATLTAVVVNKSLLLSTDLNLIGIYNALFSVKSFLYVDIAIQKF